MQFWIAHTIYLIHFRIATLELEIPNCFSAQSSSKSEGFRKPPSLRLDGFRYFRSFFLLLLYSLDPDIQRAYLFLQCFHFFFQSAEVILGFFVGIYLLFQLIDPVIHQAGRPDHTYDGARKAAQSRDDSYDDFRRHDPPPISHKCGFLFSRRSSRSAS